MRSSKRENGEPKGTGCTRSEIRDCLRVWATPTYGNRGSVRGARKFSHTGAGKGSGIRPTMKDETLHDLPNKFVKLLEICKLRTSNFKVSDIYTLMYNYRLYEIAYHRLKSNPGNMTPGMDQTTLDGTSKETFEIIIASMKNESFQFKPGRRVNVPKPKGGTRPITVAPPKDKIVQEVMRMILEAIFEPTFSVNSHGFRPNRSCHTALRQVKTQFGGASFYIEGDISQCFPSIDHGILINILRRRISDDRFLHLINKALKAGYFEFHRYNHSIIGTPQGSIISPILSNVYMHMFDVFMETKKSEFDKGKEAHRNPVYRRLENRREVAKRIGDMAEANKMLKLMQQTRARLPNDPSFRRLYYVRYADDWIVAIRGSLTETRSVLEEIRRELKQELNLDLSLTKTLVTRPRTKPALFLGTEISISDHTYFHKGKHGQPLRAVSQIVLNAPIEQIHRKLKIAGFMNHKKAGTPKFL